MICAKDEKRRSGQHQTLDQPSRGAESSPILNGDGGAFAGAWERAGREAYWAWPPDAVSVPGVAASDDWTSEAEPEVTPVPASTSSESMER